MEFVETSFFTKRVHARLPATGYRLPATGYRLPDDDYALLQAFLSANPEAGTLIPGGHGLRKVRWRSSKAGRGKSGGIRVIYYYNFRNLIYMLFAYAKNEQENLRSDQLRGLLVLMKQETS